MFDLDTAKGVNGTYVKKDESAQEDKIPVPVPPLTPIGTINTFSDLSEPQAAAKNIKTQQEFILSAGKSSNRKINKDFPRCTSPEHHKNDSYLSVDREISKQSSLQNDPFSGKFKKFKHRTPDFVLAYSKKRDEPENSKLAQYRRNYLKQLENYGLDLVHDVPGGFSQNEKDFLENRKFSNFSFIPLSGQKYYKPKQFFIHQHNNFRTSKTERKSFYDNCEPNRLDTEEDVPLDDDELEQLSMTNSGIFNRKPEIAKIIKKANKIVYTGPKVRIYYVLLYARENLLVDFAEILKLRVPINYEAMNLGDDIDLSKMLSFSECEMEKDNSGFLELSGNSSNYGVSPRCSKTTEKCVKDHTQKRKSFAEFVSQKWTAKLLDKFGVSRLHNFLLPKNPTLVAKENLKASRPLITTTFKKSDFDMNPEYYGLGEDYKWTCEDRPASIITCESENCSEENENNDKNEKIRDLFTETQIQQVIYYVLQSASYSDSSTPDSDKKYGIQNLITERAFTNAFPLHHEYEPSDKKCETQRNILFHEWASWSKWYKYQPIESIREYFGEQIALYFAWLGFYTSWLFLAAFVGICVTVYGYVHGQSTSIIQQICHANNTRMCPKCDGCPMWNLSSSCLSAQWSYVFDNSGSVFFAIFMSIWAVAFLEFWKRQNAHLSHRWSMDDYEEEDSYPRPDYCAKAKLQKANPVTGEMEPYVQKSIRRKRVLVSFASVIFMICIVLVFVASCIIYRTLVRVTINHMGHSDGVKTVNTNFANILRKNSRLVANGSAAILNLILIVIMGELYQKIAVKLTDWETHRTQIEYDNALTLKVFIFQFVNFYSSVFYVGFIKGKFTGWPGEWRETFGLRNETCAAGGCLIELAIQLGVVMIGKQILNNCTELAIPKLKKFLNKRKLKTMKCYSKDLKYRWIKDFELDEYTGLCDEYLEMVLQFGFITIFSAAFPLAAIFALLNNWVEIRLDAQKLLLMVRRPVSQRASSIGIWFKILEAIVKIAVISNAFLIAFTSQFIPHMLYRLENYGHLEGYVEHSLSNYSFIDHGESISCRYFDHRDEEGKHTLFYWKLVAAKLAFVIAFEHLVFFIGRMIDVAVPDIPESLKNRKLRLRYLAKQSFAKRQRSSLKTEVEKTTSPNTEN